jgi:arginine repressor
VRRHGRLVYALSEESDLTPADPVGAVVLALGLVRTMEASGNLVVLKTGPANAHPVAVAFDNASFPEIIGTIAGDDTAALIAREPHTGHDLIRMIEQLQKETP